MSASDPRTSRTEPRRTRTGYRELLTDWAVVCCDHQFENELGAASFARNALLAPLPANPPRAERLLRIRNAFAELGSFDGGISEFRQPGLPLNEQPDPASATAGAVLHEGYCVEPDAERAGELESIAGIVSTPRETWRAWGEKPSFRRRCRAVLGEFAVPPGLEVIVRDEAELIECIFAVADHSGVAVIKAPGIGGQGNTVINCEQPLTRLGEIDVLRSAIDGSQELTIESWLPWTVSCSASVFIGPSGTAEFLALCPQEVSQDHAKFIGSTNECSLSGAVLGELAELVCTLGDEAGSDGCRGVVGFDLIVGRRADWGRHGLGLAQGDLVVALVECNPRFNRHNRVGMLVERIADAWEVESNSIVWRLRDVPSLDQALLGERGLEQLDGDLRLLSTRPRGRERREIRLLDRLDRTMVVEMSLKPSTATPGGARQ